MAAVVTASESRLLQHLPVAKGSSCNQLTVPETNAAAQKIWNKKKIPSSQFLGCRQDLQIDATVAQEHCLSVSISSQIHRQLT